jgi:hypothetical protein
MSADRQLGRRTYAVREAYEWARRQTPPAAVLQINPKVLTQDTPAGLYADRQSVVTGPDCLWIFGGDARQCAPILTSVEELFSSEPGPRSFEQVCSTLPIDILVAKDIDPVWRNPQGWVWERQPVFANEYVRMFKCR